MTRASGRKAHSHGADFEKYLEDVVFKAALDSGYFARIDKQNPTYVAVRSRAGVAFTPKEASGVDWIALGGDSCPWHYIALEAKHSDTATLAQSRLKPHQAKHLNAVLGARQVGVLLVEFTHPPAQRPRLRGANKMNGTFTKLDKSLTATLINARNDTNPEIVLPPGSIVHAAERIAKCISFRASSDGSHFEWMYAQVDAFLTAAPLVVIKEDSHLTAISKSMES